MIDFLHDGDFTSQELDIVLEKGFFDNLNSPGLAILFGSGSVNDGEATAADFVAKDVIVLELSFSWKNEKEERRNWG